MLARFRLRARCVAAGNFPGLGGEKLHGLLFEMLSEFDPGFANGLHDMVTKPFALSLLKGGVPRPDGNTEVAAETECFFSVTSLSEEMHDALYSLSQRFRGREFRLGSAGFVGVDGVEEEGSATTYDSLAVDERPSKIVLTFQTPTSFRRRGEQVLFPLPGLVFASLASRWNAFAPWALPSDKLAEFDLVRVSRYTLRTDVVKFSEFVLLGFTGQITYSVPKDMPQPIAAMLGALARYAPYAGVGYRTTMGMGWVSAVVR